MSGSVFKSSEVADRLRPFMQKWIDEKFSTQANIEDQGAGFAIILYDTANKKERYYSFTEAGLAGALAADASGDMILLPPGTLTLTAGITVSAGVGLIGAGGDRKTILQSSGDIGQFVILSSASIIDNVYVNNSTANNAAARYAIYANNGIVLRCRAQCINAGAGKATGIYLLGTSAMAKESHGIGTNNGGGAGVGIYLLNGPYAYDCIGEGSTTGFEIQQAV